MVENPPAMQETWVPSLGWEDPLEKGVVTTFFNRGFQGGTNGKEPTCQCRRHNETWISSLGQENPQEKGIETTPVLLSRESHGQRSLVSSS